MSEQHKTSCCSKQKLAPTVVNIDPVCGMTVAEDSPHVYEHQSVRYLFCCSGCLKKFSANPEAYLTSEKVVVADQKLCQIQRRPHLLILYAV